MCSGWHWSPPPPVDIKGNFIGMNFYDTYVGTLYLQWNEIVKILSHFKGKRYISITFFHTRFLSYCH
jgi:hypothetical protein